jgi:hypothetical protein
MPTIRRAAIILESTMSAMVLIDRGSGFNIAAAKLAKKVPLSVSRVGVKPLARRIEYLDHSASVFLTSLLRISSSILGVM